MRALAAVLILAGCAAPSPAPVAVNMPLALRACPSAAHAPAPPKPPRTVESVVLWAGLVEQAREATETALRECDQRRHRLMRIIEEARAP